MNYIHASATDFFLDIVLLIGFKPHGIWCVFKDVGFTPD